MILALAYGFQISGFRTSHCVPGVGGLTIRHRVLCPGLTQAIATPYGFPGSLAQQKGLRAVTGGSGVSTVRQNPQQPSTSTRFNLEQRTGTMPDRTGPALFNFFRETLSRLACCYPAHGHYKRWVQHREVITGCSQLWSRSSEIWGAGPPQLSSPCRNLGSRGARAQVLAPTENRALSAN